MRIITGIATTLFAAIACLSQSAAPPPSFEASDVHVSPPRLRCYAHGGLTNRGTWEMHCASLLDLISIAYSMDPAKIAGGPVWLDWDRFEIIAKVPPGTTIDTVKLMLRVLLVERFRLTVHDGVRPMPAYILTAGPKLLLKPSDGTQESACKLDSSSPRMFPSYACRNLTMEAFANDMSGMGSVLQYTDNQRVVDQTGLKGTWDFNLKYARRGVVVDGATPPDAEVISLPVALSKQLGLELNRGKAAMPVLIVDGVNETPRPNPPGAAQALPKPPLDFEVAEVRPSDPDSKTEKFQIKGVHVDIQDYPLSALIYTAWRITVPESEMMGMPAWADTARFNIAAKASSIPDPAPEDGVGPSFDDSDAMLRKLLTDRFGIAMHYEERQVTGYTLLAAKPKMKKADPGSRTSCSEGVGPDGKDPRLTNPAATRLIHCTNVTMAQFGQLLFRMANADVHIPVVDKTGLQGGWDLMLNFSNPPRAAGPGRASDITPAADEQAADPTGAISLEDAVHSQLGLKLELRKHSAWVLVIDHINEKPTEN